MSVKGRLAELRRLLEDARSMPMSASIVVNRVEVIDALDSLEAAVLSATEEAEQVRSTQESILAEARQEADRILADARAEQERLASDTEVFRLAQRRGDESLTEARNESEALRRETDEYVDGKLAGFEITLDRTLEAVRRGRERLAGRSELDALREELDRDGSGNGPSSGEAGGETGGETGGSASGGGRRRLPDPDSSAD